MKITEGAMVDNEAGVSRSDGFSLSRFLKGRGTFWIILLLALMTRLYSVTAPLTDGGHERQTQVAIIARNLYREGLNVLYPRMDTFAPGPGYALLEFPLQPALMACVYHIVGVQDIVGRLVSIVFSLGSIIFMYEVAKFFLPEAGALICTAFYALTPMSIYFGRAVFPEAPLLFFSLGALYFTLRWSKEVKFSYFALSAACAALAVLVKAPPGIVMLLPISVVWCQRWGSTTLRMPRLYLYVGYSIVPIALWAIWSNRIGQQDPGWNPYQLSAIRRWGIPDAWFDSGFYLWMLKSISVVSLTPLVSFLAAIGLWSARRHPMRVVIYAWLVAMMVFVFGTPGAQMSHWNYQVPLIPVGSLLAGIGIQFLLDRGYAVTMWRILIRHRVVALLSVIFVLSGHVIIYAGVVRSAYDFKKRVPYAQEVGKIVQKEVSKEGFVLLIQPAMVPATQTYYMDRKVRQILMEPNASGSQKIAELERWREQGATGVVAVDTPYGSGTRFVTENPELLTYLRTTYRAIVEADHYLIYARR